MSVHVLAIMSKRMAICKKKMGAIELMFFAGGHTDVESRWKRMHTHVFAVSP